MKNVMIMFFAFFLLLITSKSAFPQNSLYLVDTLTGTAANNKLWKAEGIGDFNGDGYADFIVCYSNYIDLYFGNPGFTLKPAHRFYVSMAYGIGDVNGDGYADLMLISADTVMGKAVPYGEIILGGKELDTIPKFKYYPPYYWDMELTDEVYPLGDLNGDGYNDFVIASPYNWGDGLGRVYIFKGGKNLADTPWVVLKTTLGKRTHFFGTSILGIGDYNDDGYNDLLVTDPTLEEDTDKVYLYLGNKDNISTIPYKTFGPYKYLMDVKAAGDLNSNGKSDFIISANDTVRIYLGNDNPIIYDSTKLGTGGYVAIGTGGDINNDGYDDFLIGDDGYKKVSVYMGQFVTFWGKADIDTSYNFSIEGYQQYSSFAKSLSIVGDINGDGYADVFVLAPSYRNYDNLDSTVGRLYIYSYVKITGIKDKDIITPNDFKLNQNYPNPFNSSTAISFQLSAVSYVTLKIFNSLGQEIITLINNLPQSTGEHKIEFNAEKYSLSSGVYFLELDAANIHNQFKEVIKIVYLK